MAYTIEDINKCTKKIVFNFEELDLTKEINQALKAKQKEANLKGFRKGKAPLDMIQKFYGPQVESDALNRFVQNEFFNAVDTEKLKVVGQPSFENVNYESGKKVSFDALVEIFPDFDLADMSGLSFTRDKVEVTDEEVERTKKSQLEAKAEVVELEDESAALDKGMLAVFNFEGEKEDGERPENMKGEDYQLEIGSGQFIPGFEEGMVGMKKGEKKTLELTFPEDYHVDELKSAKVKFYVELLEIKTKNYPELTDELAKEFGHESVADMDNKIRTNIETQKSRQADQKLHEEILKQLVDDNKFDVPRAMVVQQEQYLLEDLKRNLQGQGFTEDMMAQYFEKWQSDMTEKAEFQVRSGLILDKLAKEHSVEATEADLDKKINETAEQTGLSADQVKQYYVGNEQMKRNMTYAIREEKTFEKIKELVKVS